MDVHDAGIGRAMLKAVLILAACAGHVAATKLEVVVVEQIPFAAQQATWVSDLDAQYHG